MIPTAAAGCLGVRAGSAIVSVDSADAASLLSAASGLVGALVRAGQIPLGVSLATAFLRLGAGQGLGAPPISSLGHVQTPESTFPGICLTEHVAVQIGNQTLEIPVNAIQSIRVGSRRRWELRPRATFHLVDGSVYKQVAFPDCELEFLTLLGRQSVPLRRWGTAISGSGVQRVGELRHRINVTLAWHRPAVLKSVGPVTFERYFTAATAA